MRNHGWELPYHPLQTVAVAVFSGISFSFYVFFIPFVGNRVLQFHIYAIFSPVVLAAFMLYVKCVGCDPADVGVHQSKRAVPSAMQRAALNAIKGSGQSNENGPQRAAESEPSACARWLCLPFACFRAGEDKVNSGEQLLYCTICEAEISKNSKHCRACDKCVHGFDHHCRWLNNCVGKRNYRAFVSLMMASLLLLIIVWTTGIGVLVRCFSEKYRFETEIIHRLGSSFSRVAYIIVVVFLSLLAMLATIPLCQLFFFHLILIHKGITTYDYILAVREEAQPDHGEQGGEGIKSLTSSPASSHGTGASAGFSSAGAPSFHRGVFCTPPRMFVEHHQKVLESRGDLETSTTKMRPRYPAAHHPHKKPSGINPWKLARMNPEAKEITILHSKASSQILTETEDSSVDLSSRDVSGEISTKFNRTYLTGKERVLLMKERRSKGSPSGGLGSYPGSSYPTSPDTSPGKKLKLAEDEPIAAVKEKLVQLELSYGEKHSGSLQSLVQKYKSTVASTSVVVTPREKAGVWEDGSTPKPSSQEESTRGSSSGSRAEANILKHVRKEWPHLRDRVSDSPDACTDVESSSPHNNSPARERKDLTSSAEYWLNCQPGVSRKACLREERGVA